MHHTTVVLITELINLIYMKKRNIRQKNTPLTLQYLIILLYTEPSGWDSSYNEEWGEETREIKM